MNGFMLMKMSLNRFRLLLFTTLVASVMVFSAGITCAEQPADTAKQGAEKAKAPPAPTAAEAATARAMRDAAVQRRHAIKDYIRKVTEGQQPAPEATPANDGKGGAK